jgi:hypothetical protein
MKILIDGGASRVHSRIKEWPEKIGGQLITALTAYSRHHEIFAVDNGAYSGFREERFKYILRREAKNKDYCLFVAVPDKVGSHKETLVMWDQYNNLADGWKKAFVAQDGYNGYPKEADCLFIGGTNHFKDSKESFDAVVDAKKRGLFVHVGRVTGVKRFMFYEDAGADTCDGSGLSRFDKTFTRLKETYNNQRGQYVLF